MNIIPEIDQFKAELTRWRRYLHANPEIAFSEHNTAAFVADKLESFGIEVTTGIAGTGVVGTLKRGRANRAIGLRADMDALPIMEENSFEHRSQIKGMMHACGHDGHTVMLLGAAKFLAENPVYEGTVQFIFQPAEENEGGARVMIEDGLFENFPVESIYAMHNIPGMPVGHFASQVGPIMAAFDIFKVIIKGVGAHAAMPHLGIDPIIIGTKLVEAYQTIISRFIDTKEPAVISVTRFHGGDSYNVIPHTIEISGCTRCFTPKIQLQIETKMRELTSGICSAFGAEVEFSYERRYPPTINSELETGIAGEVAKQIVGETQVHMNAGTAMGSEDFAYMLQERPGNYMWIGNGGDASAPSVHHPRYEFNDAILPLGATYFAKLVEHLLPVIDN